MTRLLERALAEMSKLSEDEQDAIAAWLLEQLESERRWGDAFARSGDLLDRMADEALREFHEGRTKPLIPDEL